MADNSKVYINAIATACPPDDGQKIFLDLIPQFLPERDESLFRRLMERSQMTAVIIGPMQPHAIDALLASLKHATSLATWRCPHPPTSVRCRAGSACAPRYSARSTD